MSLLALNVTNVRLALECPRLFYLGHHEGGTTVFRSPSEGMGIGTAFHQVSADCVRSLLQDPNLKQRLEPAVSSAAAGRQRSQKLSQWLRSHLYKTVFFPYLQSIIRTDASRAKAMETLWQALGRLVDRWATLLVNNRRFCPAAEVVGKTFIAQELSVDHTFTLPDGSAQPVQGRLDCLVYDFAHRRLCVVEYKTYRTPDSAPQLAQVALYSKLLQSRVGVPINAALYSVLPDWQERAFVWEALEDSWNQLIPQRLQLMQQWLTWHPGQPDPPPETRYKHLCDLCPQQQKCQHYFANPTLKSPQQLDLLSQLHPSGARKKRDRSPSPPPPLPPSPHPTAPDQINAIALKLVRTLRAFNIGVDAQGTAIAPAFIRVKLKPQLGVKVNSILKLTDDLRVQLGLTAPPMIAPQAGYVSVDLPRPDRQTAVFDYYVSAQVLSPTAPVQIAIGVDLEGNLVEADLSDANTCHFLVGGTTGSGKSEFLRSLLLSLLVRHSPEMLQIALVDPKRVTFPEFETMPWLLEPIVKDSEGAIALMTTLMDEMDRRYQRFEQSRCADLSRYNQQAKTPMPRIVCIFDEYADLMSEKESKAAIEQSIKRLGAMARAAGIHLIIATQRPDAKVVTPLIRSNLPGRVALRTASDADSAIILGGKQGDAVNLLGKGDLLYLKGAQLLRLQSLFAPQIVLQQIEK
ncbi:MAG: DNA translocase FtsK [Cyanobacteria bacterium P01_A01_bin.123]